jgi:hypothetical protein
MKGDETAAQTLKVATLDHLRQAAGVDNSFNGNFTQAGYNKALRALEPKLGSLLDPAARRARADLGDVARYSQFQPEGHYVNNSNTFVASAANKADALARKASNKAGGIPIGHLRSAEDERAAGEKTGEKTFAPGAGLTRLSDLTEVERTKK